MVNVSRGEDIYAGRQRQPLVRGAALGGQTVCTITCHIQPRVRLAFCFQLAIIDYLEDIYPDNSIVPKDPIKKAQVKCYILQHNEIKLFVSSLFNNNKCCIDVFNLKI